ncbi:MAG: shikimate dehydrogenase [Deltaproteobacteria bacterium]
MKVFCVLSDARAFRSKSPAMHNAVLEQQGINGVYVPFAVEPDRIGDAVRGLRALNIAGANVTVPHKELVIPYLDTLSEEASAVGAVNTIVIRGASLMGDNTDTGGFLDALERVDFSAAGKSVLVFGAGGVSKAVVVALGRLGPSEILLAGRNPHRTRHTASTFGAAASTFGSLTGRPIRSDLVVNATSVSSPGEDPKMADFVSSLDLSHCELVVDLNYGRDDNFWRELATTSGALFMDGLPMLAHQARRSFALWTGIEVDAAIFMEPLKENP